MSARKRRAASGPSVNSRRSDDTGYSIAVAMYLAYVDESGDRGKSPPGSRTYVLSCVLIKSVRWKHALDSVIGFRRFLKKTLGVPVRAEIKANALLKNGGDFRTLGLSEHSRRFIYRGSLRLQKKLGLSVFAIVIDKPKLFSDRDPMELAWTYLLQRLETLTRKQNDEVMVIHDEGESDFIRKLARKRRRAGFSGSLFGGYRQLPFHGLIDDVVPRNSRHSLFLQLADLDAYAAFRRVVPPPKRAVNICPHLMWEELGTARFAPANMRVGGPSEGIVLWPTK